MCQSLDGVDYLCKRDVVAVPPLEVAVASTGSFLLVTPTIGMVGGDSDMEVVTEG